MAKTNYHGYVREAVVPLKKCFYDLRLLLAARWVLKTGAAAPVEFEKLLFLLAEEPAVLEEVRKLLEKKRQAPELGSAAAVPILNQFIESEPGDEPRSAPEKSRSPNIVDLLNSLFHDVLNELGDHGAT